MRDKLGRMVKGNKPWNAGVKGIHLSPDTEFKEGVLTGKEHPSWKGGIQHISNDCTHVWVAANKRVRRPRQIYEDVYGKIPPGYVIFHKDGNKDNDEYWNLEAINRAELLKRNMGWE